MSESHGERLYRVLNRAQRRLQGGLGDLPPGATGPSRDNLREERDTLSRLKTALRGLRPEHIATLKTHTDDYTSLDTERYGEVITILERVLAAAASQERTNA